MLLDAHTHLDLYDEAALDAALDEIAAHHILTIAVAMNPPSYERTRDIAARSQFVVPCFGIHPWEAHRYAHSLDAFQPLIDASPLLGEIGLDYIWDENPAHYPAQRAVFAYFLQAAAAQDKIVNLHTKGAEHDVVTMLGQFSLRRAIVHWYSGPRDAFEALIAHDCYFTFGVETSRSPNIQLLAQAAPLERILTETDGPEGLRWLTGEVGMPRHIHDVLQAIADARGLGVADMANIVVANWQRLIAGDRRLKPWARW